MATTSITGGPIRSEDPRYRVELEEIENAAGGPGRASAWPRGAVQMASLAAFVVPENGWTPEAFGSLEAALREALPDYMVPAGLEFCGICPVTVAREVEPGGAPSAERAAAAQSRSSPPERAEARLAEVFREF